MATTAPRASLRLSARVVVLATLAIAFPLLFALAIIGAGAAVVYLVGSLAVVLFKFLWLLLVPLFVGLRGLVISAPAREGEPLIEAHAPELFALIEVLRRVTKAGRVHGVYLTDQLNASLVQTPRFGIFGGTRNELYIGLPLMAAMDEIHFTAVVAHEIGHLSKRHGSFLQRIYAMRQTLDVILIGLDRRRSPLVYPVAWFYRAIVPRFELATLELSRAVEFEADAVSAEAVSAPLAAEALVVGDGITELFEAEVWPSIFTGVADEPEPPADVYAAIVERFRTPAADGAKLVGAALAARTFATDTHPALADRLRALGSDPSAMAKALDHYAVGDRNAATVFLAGAGAQRRVLAGQWRGRVRGRWAADHAEQRRIRERLDALDATNGVAGTEPSRERAVLAAALERDDAPTLLIAASDAQPTDAELAFRAGAALAANDRAEAPAYVERAIAADATLAIPAWLLARGYFERRGDAARVAEYDARLTARRAELVLADRERGRFTGAEPIGAHGLTDDELAPVRKALDLADIAGTYLARRTLVHLPEIPHFVLAVARNRSKYGTSDANIATIVHNDLAAYRYGVTVVVSSKPRNRIVDALRAVDGTALRL